MATAPPPKSVDAIKHDDAKRKNIPTAEYQSVLDDHQKNPKQVRYPRSNTHWLNELATLHDMGKANPAFQQCVNRELDPQLIWRGKDEQDWSDLVVHAPPLYIQEKVHPKALIDELLRESKEREHEQGQVTPDLFSDFNGIPKDVDKTEFYQHDQNWTNRMILGDSLQVMASLAEREGLRGKVQCIYFDPPYGIKFNSNFQWSTTSRDVKDGKADHITREPEQVKAFRDTWRDGIHSYLTYLRDRLTVARDLLTESGSIFVQIGDENVHRVRAVMDEVFGDANFVAMATVRKTTSDSTALLGSTCDFVLWFAKNRESAKARTIWAPRGDDAEDRYSGDYGDGRRFQLGGITSSRPPGEGDLKVFRWFGKSYEAGNATFKTTELGLTRAAKADRLAATSGGKLRYRRFHNDFGYTPIANLWTDISGAVQSRSDPKVYVVQSSTTIVERCILMATDPGDLVLDPTCGSGTTAYVAEQWGRRWITIDTSRIARQKEIDASIAAKAEHEYLYDKPYENKKAVRVAGPFTVESLSPHRVLGVDEDDELIDTLREPGADYAAKQSFPQMILENLKTAGVQQAHKEDRISFTALTAWPGELVCAEGRYLEAEGSEKRAAIFIGPEFGTVQRADLVEAAREAADAGFDVLIACAFNFEAHTTEFSRLGKLPVLKARMNADLHMAEDLKNTGKGNLFVIFGEPDITLIPEEGLLRVKVNGVDVFKPQTGEVISDGADGIACWFVDTDYNQESFFVRHAYFLGANDPYKALKTTLKAEIDPEAWASLNSDTSRPFKKPKSGRIAVKVINHLGDEVMKVFRVA